MSQDVLGSGALADVAGPLKDLADKLGGSKGPMWLSALKRFLRQENPWMPKLIRQATITVGGATKEQLTQRLKDEGNFVSELAKDLMAKPVFTTLAQPTEIEFGWITVRDLGFDTEPTTDELLARIKEVGEVCQAEDGPHLRLADKNQLRGTWYWVAHEPISDSSGRPYVFYVERHADDQRWLHAYYARPRDRWYLGRVVVLRLRT